MHLIARAKLKVAEVYRSSVDRDSFCGRVLRSFSRPSASAKKPVQPRQKNIQIEGLGKVIISTGLKPIQTSSGRPRAVNIKIGV